jgi:hypothetical protein
MTTIRSRKQFLSTQLSVNNREEKKDRLIKNLLDLSKNRNYLSSDSNTVTNTIKNAVLDLIRAEGIENPTNNQLNDRLSKLLNEAKLSRRLDRVDESRIDSLINLCKNHKIKMLSDSGLFFGRNYQDLNYIHNAKNNPSSIYNAINHKQQTIDKYIICLNELSSNLKINNKNNLNKYIEQLTNTKKHIGEPDLNRDYRSATKKDWQVNISYERRTQKIEIFFNKVINELRSINPGCSELNKKSVNKLIKNAYIKAQYTVLNAEKNINTEYKVTGGNIKLTSNTEKLCNTNPSIIRGKYNQLPKETRDDPINLYKHIIKISVDGKEHTHSIIRNGHIHGGSLKNTSYIPEAARKYVEEMARLSTFKNKDGVKILVDNRLMYDRIGPGGESKLNAYHKEAITRAVNAYNIEHKDEPIKIIFLNFPPKNYQNVSKNKESITDLRNDIINQEGNHAKLYEDDGLYRSFFDMLDKNKTNPEYFSGKNGYDYAFVVQYVCSRLGIAFSEGCKSNKDRGSMKKMHDEIYYAKLYQTSAGSAESTIKDFFKIKSEKIFQDVVLNNSSAHITGLNTSYSGNKNTSGVNWLLSSLGFKNRNIFFKGMSKYAKG